MGYLLDHLRNVLEGKSSASNWTPNDVRAVVITRDFILVAHHTSPASKVLLDRNEVQIELSAGVNTGALHNLLTKRQLSCMEEIYVDGMFQNYRGIMDLEGYVRKISSDSLRLRYYGYIDSDISILTYLYGVYDSLRYDLNYQYSIAKDTNRRFKVMYEVANEVDWYKKYNLRPQFYKRDSEKGILAQYFRKCEAEIGSVIAKQQADIKDKAFLDVVKAIMSVDLKYCEDVYAILLAKNYAKKFKSNDPLYVKFSKAVVSAMSEVYKSPITGLKEKYFENYTRLLQMYKLLRRIDNEGELSTEYIEKHELMSRGFLNAREFLDSICYHIISGASIEVTLSMQLNFVTNRDTIPSGRFRSKLGGGECNYEGIDGYMSLILGFLGINKNILRGE